ncbi:MAG: formylmethanofuran dehydrogenase subunit E family protein [Desulfuromonadales bacterium]|nr:formylmethanofuran dehydrogenase subunit E family protein [Desulfuromonadales bacterium]
MDLPPHQLFAEIYEIHGHRCPMSTLGGRLGFAARQKFTGHSPLRATYFIATCAADGISVMTGCSQAAGTMRIVARERHALWLENDDGCGLFAELSPHALQLAGTYRTLDLAFQKEEARLAKTERQQRLTSKELFLEELLQQLWNLPDEELMNFATALPADLVVRPGLN